jgi:hypothetical protein
MCKKFKLEKTDKCRMLMGKYLEKLLGGSTKWEVINY